MYFYHDLSNMESFDVVSDAGMKSDFFSMDRSKACNQSIYNCILLYTQLQGYPWSGKFQMSWLLLIFFTKEK